MRRFLLTTFLAWLFFLMLDFLAHAILLKSIWTRNLVALKTQEELFDPHGSNRLALCKHVQNGWQCEKLSSKMEPSPFYPFLEV